MSKLKNHEKNSIFLSTQYTNMPQIILGTNLQALIDSTQDNNDSTAEIVLVISNKPEVQGLVRAARANIQCKVCMAIGYSFIKYNP